MRDDSGRSPQIELEPERSFSGPLSGQSVYEQTSGVLRHTESVRDDKVQNRTGGRRRKKSRAQATTSLLSLSRCQAARVSVMTKSRLSGQSQTHEATLSDGSSSSVAAYFEAAGVRSLALAMSHLELIASGPPSRPRYGTTSCTVTPQVSREVCVLRLFGQSRLFDEGCQQIATTAIVPFNTGLWQHSFWFVR